jgi:hypothetical protein
VFKVLPDELVERLDQIQHDDRQRKEWQDAMEQRAAQRRREL